MESLLEVDIRQFFDTLDHKYLQTLLSSASRTRHQAARIPR